MDMPADFTLKSTFPPFSGKGADTSIWTIPGYQSGQRVASLKSPMVSSGGASMWTSRCTIAIGGPPRKDERCALGRGQPSSRAPPRSQAARWCSSSNSQLSATARALLLLPRSRSVFSSLLLARVAREGDDADKYAGHQGEANVSAQDQRGHASTTLRTARAGGMRAAASTLPTARLTAGPTGYIPPEGFKFSHRSTVSAPGCRERKPVRRKRTFFMTSSLARRERPAWELAGEFPRPDRRLAPARWR